MRNTVSWLFLLSLITLSGCYSPVRKPYDPSQWSASENALAPAASEPTEAEVGMGIHAWPWFEKDRSTPRHRTDVFWPLVKHVRQPEGWYFRIAPLLWMKRTPKEDYTFVFPWWGKYERNDRTLRTYAFPFVWTQTAPDGWRAILFPFLWIDRDGPEKQTWAFPFYGQVKGRNFKERHVMWPIVKHKRSESRTEFRLWPLIKSENNASGRKTNITPFITIDRQGEKHETWVWPLYGHEQSGMGVSPMKTHGQDAHGTNTHHLLWPFVKHQKDEQGTRFRIFPFVWVKNLHNELNDERSTWVFPLFGQTTERYTTSKEPIVADDIAQAPEAFSQPFVAPEEKEVVRKETNIFWPFIRRYQEGEQSEFSIFPFLWLNRDKNAASTYVLPFYWNGWENKSDWSRTQAKMIPYTRRYGAIFPFYIWDNDGERQSRWAPFPLNYDEKAPQGWSRFIAPIFLKRNEHEQETWVVPFYGQESTSDTQTMHALWPIVKASKGKDQSSFRIFPMLDVHRSPNYNKTHIPILVGSSNSPDRSEWYALWPFFSGLKQGTRQEIRAPWPLLTMEGKDGKWKDIESWPLYQYLHKEWTEKDGTAHVLTSHEAPSILPLIAGNTRDGHKEGYFLGPLYTWDLRDKTHQDRRLLWQFAYHTKRPSGTTTALYPFWYKETNSKGESSWGIIYDLISRTKKEDGTKWRWLWFVEY